MINEIKKNLEVKVGGDGIKEMVMSDKSISKEFKEIIIDALIEIEKMTIDEAKEFYYGESLKEIKDVESVLYKYLNAALEKKIGINNN